MTLGPQTVPNNVLILKTAHYKLNVISSCSSFSATKLTDPRNRVWASQGGVSLLLTRLLAKADLTSEEALCLIKEFLFPRPACWRANQAGRL